MTTRRGGCICTRSCPEEVVRHIVLCWRLWIRRSANFRPCQGPAIDVHVARGRFGGIEEYKWYREHYHTISMGCQSGQLTLHPRRWRPDLVKYVLAGPVFKFTYLFYFLQSCTDGASWHTYRLKRLGCWIWNINWGWCGRLMVLSRFI